MSLDLWNTVAALTCTVLATYGVAMFILWFFKKNTLRKKLSFDFLIMFSIPSTFGLVLQYGFGLTPAGELSPTGMMIALYVGLISIIGMAVGSYMSFRWIRSKMPEC